jgi:N-acetylmuramoyl-L-alanine amidase
MTDIISQPSPNFDSRNGTPVSLLIMHYTGMESGTAAIERLCDPAARVSSHYVVEEDGRIFALVAEENRAWHAGVSYWRGKTNLNAHSIGIEIVNPGHENGYRAFPDVQMQAVLDLSKSILARHSIAARDVIGHSDIAPVRKIDPGELFDWEWLAANGVGQPVPKVDLSAFAGQLWTGDSSEAVRALQQQLRSYGYDVEASGVYDTQTEIVVSAFQRHFRRSFVTGIADAETQAVLAQLLTTVG